MNTTAAHPAHVGVQLPPPGHWTIDTAHTSVAFWTRHLGVARVRGRFSEFSGAAVIADDPASSSIEVSIEAGSIDTRQPARDEHLRSGDFLDVAAHPQLTFRSLGVSGYASTWQITGELTVRGVTREVVLDASYDGFMTDPDGDVRAFFTATTEIDREAFGLTWNQALESGGVLVGKRIHIELDVELVRNG
jgi:polyisoprenoid-binding protein YceI